MIHKRSKNAQRLRSTRSATVTRVVRTRRPLHRKVLLHPISLFVLLCVGVLLADTTWHSLAATYSIRAKVPASLLTAPAIITAPADGSTVTSTPITVRGTCPADSYVTLTRNNLFSGVDTCDNSTLTFSITTDLFAGANQLVAQDYNFSDDAGPASSPITVTYAPLVSSLSSGAGSSGSSGASSATASGLQSDPLVLRAAYRYRVFQAGQPFRWDVDISGGTAPYSVRAQWGDGGVSNITVTSGRTFTIAHTYGAPGRYTIALTAGDAHSSTTFLQLMGIIQGTAPAGAAANSTPSGAVLSKPWLWLALPAYGTVALMAASFWLGERQELRQLARGRRGASSRAA